MIVKFKCNLCGNEIKKLVPSLKDLPLFLHCQCGGMCEKSLPEFSVASYETIDTGNMQKKVELRKDAIKSAKEKGDNYIKTMNERDRIIKKEEH